MITWQNSLNFHCLFPFEVKSPLLLSEYLSRLYVMYYWFCCSILVWTLYCVLMRGEINLQMTWIIISVNISRGCDYWESASIKKHTLWKPTKKKGDNCNQSLSPLLAIYTADRILRHSEYISKEEGGGEYGLSFSFTELVHYWWRVDVGSVGLWIAQWWEKSLNLILIT